MNTEQEELKIQVYTVYLDGLLGPTYDSEAGVVGDFEEAIKEVRGLNDGTVLDFRVKVGYMTRAEIDAMPEFTGY